MNQYHKITTLFSGTREEWEELHYRGHDRVIDDTIALLKAKQKGQE